MCYYHVTLVNKDGLRLTLTNIKGPIYQSDVPKIENMVNTHPDHKTYGPWKIIS